MTLGTGGPLLGGQYGLPYWSNPRAHFSVRSDDLLAAGPWSVTSLPGRLAHRTETGPAGR